MSARGPLQKSFFSVKLTFPNLQTYSYIRIPMTMSPRGGAHFCPQPMAYKIKNVSSSWTGWGLKGFKGYECGECPLTEPGDPLLLPSPHSENPLAMPLVYSMLGAILTLGLVAFRDDHSMRFFFFHQTKCIRFALFFLWIANAYIYIL